MKLELLVLVLGPIVATVSGAVVGATMKLYCTYTIGNKQLRLRHQLWAHVWLMERDFMNDDVLNEYRKVNRNRSPQLSFTLYSEDIDDGVADESLEVYLYIKHNCVRNHAKSYQVKIVEVGTFPVDNYYPAVKDMGTIYLP